MKKRPTAYLKMKVLGAVEFAEGTSIRQRIKTVSEKTFVDEDGQALRMHREDYQRMLMEKLKQIHAHGVLHATEPTFQGTC